LTEAKNESLNRNLDIMAYTTVQDFAKFLDECIQTLKTNQYLTHYQHLELIGIFFPTGEWDDAHGSQDVANHITDIIEQTERYQFQKQICEKIESIIYH
jgi:hypothetical protein